jgi:site-specific recombinase XerD
MPNRRYGEEYPPKSGIIIAPKNNPSGSKAYRVDILATITGNDREQRQFPTQSEARKYAGRRHLEIAQFGHAAFSLTSLQRNDATRAIWLLAPYRLTLEDAAKLAISHTPRTREGITVAQLRTLFLAAPGRQKNRLAIRRPHTLRGLKWRTARFEKRFGREDVTSIQTSQIKEWLASQGEMSPVSLNNFRRALHAMFSFAVTEGYCASNPVTTLPFYAVPDKAPAILSVTQASALLAAAAKTEPTLGLLGYVTLGLFAGLRRAELERLDWEAIKLDRRMVTVDGSIAKTGSIRNVTLSANALAWLATCAKKSGWLTPRNLNHRLRRLRILAGISHWAGNELRHSFASYHYDLHQNAPLTAAMLGHTSGTNLLFQHYRSLVQLGEGERYFSIAPVAAEGTSCPTVTGTLTG